MATARALPLLAACVGLLGCAANRAVSPPVHVAPVRTDSVATRDFFVRGQFAGTATRRGEWVEVVIPAATITVPPGDASRWRSLRVRAGLATGQRGGRQWTIASQSLPVTLWPVLGLREDASHAEAVTRVLADTLRFAFGVPPGAMTGESWVVFQLEWPAGYADAARFASTYAHGDVLRFGRPASPQRLP